MTAAVRPFHGGVVLARHKEPLRRHPSRRLALPSRLVYPLRAHVGTPASPVVHAGQSVLRGELLAVPGSYVSQSIHAATSGVIADIAPRPIIHPAGLADVCIVLEADGQDRALEPWRPLDAETATSEALQARIVDAGIIGMGGAGFPTHVKLREGMTQSVRLLIINGVECEPYIDCDDCVLREHAAEVVQGARILMRALRAQRCLLALEEDMEEAAAAAAGLCGDGVELVRVPAIYPAGGEKQLIRMLTGSEVPAHGLPIQAGIVMHNVATAFAVYEAVAKGLPLTERVVTVAGAVREPANLRVPLGTPVADLIAACGGVRTAAQLIIGGPMMGTAVASDAVPVGKTTNCVLLLDRTEMKRQVMPCIRCGECVEVCPAQLQPQALYEFARVGDWIAAQDYHLFDCIECGACAYICPSHLPLVHYYRHAKSQIEALESERQHAAELKQRFETRQRRLASGTAAIERDTEEPDGEAATTGTVPDRATLKAEIAASIARARVRRQQARQRDVQLPHAPAKGNLDP